MINIMWHQYKIQYHIRPALEKSRVCCALIPYSIRLKYSVILCPSFAYNDLSLRFNMCFSNYHNSHRNFSFQIIELILILKKQRTSKVCSF